MSDRKIWVLGFVVGVIIVLLLFIILAVVRGTRQTKAMLDERQITARNAAYKCAFFGLLIYSVVCAVLDMLEIKWATTSAMLFLGVFGSTTLFAVLSILKDAYVPFNQTGRKTSVIPWMMAVGILNLAVFFMDLWKGDSFFTDGLLNENILNPCLAVMFLGIGTTQLVKNQIDKKAAEEE